MSRYAEAARKWARRTLPETSLLSIAELEDNISTISTELKGPGVGASDRIVLNEYRHAYRAELEKRASVGLITGKL